MIDERIEIENGTTWPNPRPVRYSNIVWALRSKISGVAKYDRDVAASVMEAYKQLLTMPTKDATATIRMIKRALKK